MAIAFARPEYVGRSDNKNACCKSSYNSRSKIVDERAGKVFNFTNHGGNAYHEMLLPEYVDKKFKNAEGFSNEVERAEKRKDSQLYVEWLLALPKEKEITLEMKKEIIKEFIERKGWIKEGLGVQVDIHEPHDGEKNWHAHLLVTTRRFKKDGLGLEDKKAVDLQPEIKYRKVQKTAEIDNHKFYENVLNDKFKAWGLDLRADLPGEITQEHVGPVRMRSIFNEAVQRNEERKEAEIELLNSGVRVLEKVTKHMSVFTRGDLVRAVKCIPDNEARARLVEDAVSDKSIIPLYREEGNKTQYFTTEAVRAEENKIVRLSQYVANDSNVFARASGKSVNYNNLLAGISNNAGLSEEQNAALSNLILTESGIRILRGRAGAGKSFVLKKIPIIAEYAGVNVIGVAPTHKAKLELASDGFKNTDTIKGMLFKLANGRFSLPKHSLIVVDEAGMVGNDDYRELLRVAATRKCNVIAAGDEKQLASVQRGGMFEVFADRYGSSSILDIKRQDSDWGKSVAINMSAGNVETAISILGRENCIKWDADRDSSMNALLADWSKSDHDISDRLILAVKNKDVAALNHGARQYLKLEGKLAGNEMLVAGNHYMKGDKILITKTNKELGLINGDLAELVVASEGKFTIKLAGGAKDQDDKNISFNPSEYNGFRHGYATTVFKAQAASIKGVYVYHDGFAGIRNSYVALSRFVEELKLYTNKESTSNLNSLVRQLSQDAEAGSSLSYLTEKELEYNRISHKLANDKNRFVRGFNSLLDFANNAATKLTDKYIPSSQYYNYKEPKAKYEPASKVIEKTYNEIEKHNQAIMEEKMVVGGNVFSNHDKSSFSSDSTTSSSKSKDISAGNEIIGVMGNLNITGSTSSAIHSNTGSIGTETSNTQEATASSSQISESGKVRQSAKTRFYANVDRIRAQKQYEAQKEEWSREYEQLKSELKFKAEYIARDLLGDPNKRLSNGMELRYGDHGKLAVRITGEKAGTWYDFARGEGGDLFHLAQEVRKTSFKEAADYLKSSVGMSLSNTKPNLQLVIDHTNSDLTIDRIKSNQEEKRLNEKKQAYSTKLYERSKDIGEKSVAHRYLTITRNINVDLGDDIKTAGIYERSKKGYLPALLAYARDVDGNITGGQHLLLDKSTNGKANIDNPKKSFGAISGSFVNLGNTNTKTISSNNVENAIESDITIIAEGIETGLSVKQAMSEHSEKGEIPNNTKISSLCSLGISNIKNYEPTQGQKIIIASDNDGQNSITEKTIENAKASLEKKGAFVEIVKPARQGDFNDILQDKESGGSKVIADCFKGAIARHSSKTLEEYIANTKQTENSSRAKNQQFFSGDKANLAIIQKYNISQENILNAWRINPEKGKEELVSTALEISLTEKHLEENRDILDLATNHGIKVDEAHLVRTLFKSPASCQQECINHVLSGFAGQKQGSGKIGDVFNIIKKEDKFLSEVNIKGGEELDQNLKNRLDLSKTEKSKDIISSIKQNIEASHKQGIISYDDLLQTVVASGHDIKGLDTQLKSLADENRSSGLFAISTELEELSKIGYSYDPDKILGDFRSMSYEEKKNYGKNLLHKEMTKYLEHNLAKYSQDRKNANNAGQSIKAILEESKAYAKLYDKHKMGIHIVDKVNGNPRYILLTKSAYDLHNKYNENEITNILNYGLKNNITNIKSIKNTLNDNGGNFKKAYDPIRIQHNLNQAKQVEASTAKTTHERSFYYPVTLSFDNKPTDSLEKTIRSLGIRFNKFRQEWYGDVKEQHLTKLTKSIENYKHDIDIRQKEEYGKSSKQEKQSEIKIDKGFSM